MAIVFCEQKIAAIEAVEALETCNIWLFDIPNRHMDETMRNYKLIIATCTCKLKLKKGEKFFAWEPTLNHISSSLTCRDDQKPIYENKNRVICWEEIFSLMKAVAFSGMLIQILVLKPYSRINLNLQNNITLLTFIWTSFTNQILFEFRHAHMLDLKLDGDLQNNPQNMISLIKFMWRRALMPWKLKVPIFHTHTIAFQEGE
ncbi:hypothetical protein ACJX0J_024116, partial [Zea mays]